MTDPLGSYLLGPNDTPENGSKRGWWEVEIQDSMEPSPWQLEHISISSLNHESEVDLAKYIVRKRNLVAGFIWPYGRVIHLAHKGVGRALCGFDSPCAKIDIEQQWFGDICRRCLKVIQRMITDGR